MTATLSRADSTSSYMRPGGARRALLTFLQYDGSIAGSHNSTLRLICFPGCSIHDLRPLLAPFGIVLRTDGTGEGVTPAGSILCTATALGGPRPVLTFWKTAAVERAVLSGVFKKQNGMLGILPVAVFKEVLWPWVKLAARSGGDLDKAMSDALYFREHAFPALSLSDSSDGLLPNGQDQLQADLNMSDSEDSNSSASDESDDGGSDGEQAEVFDGNQNGEEENAFIVHLQQGDHPLQPP